LLIQQLNHIDVKQICSAGDDNFTISFSAYLLFDYLEYRI
jgi:hypothetical protein